MQLSFERIVKVPTYRVIAEAISSQILEGRLREGDQVPTEAQLCEMFGVNRSSVREAIRVLEEANLIRRENAKRLVVSRPSWDEMGNQLKRALVLHEITYGELWEAMLAVEPAMSRLAATRNNPEIISHLQDNLAHAASAVKVADQVTLLNLDIQFHGLIATMCSNRALSLAWEPISKLFYPSFREVFDKVPASGKRLLTAHKNIVEAITNGDGAQAESWMEKHIRDFERGLEVAGHKANEPVIFQP